MGGQGWKVILENSKLIIVPIIFGGILPFIPIVMMIFTEILVSGGTEDIFGFEMISTMLFLMPVSMGLGGMIGLLLTAIIKGPHRKLNIFNPQQSKPELASPLSDEDIFVCNCIEIMPNSLFILGFLGFGVLAPVIVIVLTPIIGFYIPEIPASFAPVGGVLGQILIMGCISVTFISLLIGVQFIAGGYSCVYPRFLAGFASLFEIISIILIIRYAALMIVRSFAPDFAEHFFLIDFPTGQVPATIVYFLVITAMVICWTVFAIGHGLRVFGNARRGLYN